MECKVLDGSDNRVVQISGQIDEDANFEKAFGATPKVLVVICKDIKRINSIGIKAWVTYFKSLVKAGTQVKIREASTALVTTMNILTGFIKGLEVESICVPYRCKKCAEESVALFSIPALKGIGFNVPAGTCTKCSGVTECDDLKDEYFGVFME